MIFKVILERYYIYNSQYGGKIVESIEFFMFFKNRTIGNYIYYVIVLINAFILYYFIMRNRLKNLLTVIDITDQMASGDLDKKIEVNCKGDIKKLADNINIISLLLKNVTKEERKAQQTKSELITNVSHDLRTPLTSIKGYLGLINDDKYRDEVQLRHYVDIAYEKSIELDVLINDLFELTKVQNETINLDKIEINLVELLSQIMFQFDYQFQSENIEGRTFFSEDKLIIEGDVTKLVRAFQNLINNGIKYGKGDYLDICTYKEDNFAVIEVINYGNPIESIELPFIFDRFYRVEKSRNKNDGGSGLGLAITKSIVNLHNGFIDASSNDEKTVFTVKLPLLNK